MRGESGRSLTEMMGTLAIMGILAITGIWMYNSAMDRLKANTIINEAQKRAVVVAGQIGFQDRTDPSLGEFSDNEFAGSTFSTNVITNGLYKQFGIQVSGVSKNVCQNILNAIGDSTPLRRLTPLGNPRTPITGCEETNAFLMIYNNDMSGSSGDTAYTCEKDSDCSACGTCNTETHACENDCEIPTPNGGCDFDNECNQGNECMICDTTTRTCKDACTRVEYLQSDGNQYIDTQVVLTQKHSVEITTKLVDTIQGNSKYLFGVGPATNRYVMGVSMDNGMYNAILYSNNTKVFSNISGYDGLFHTLKISNAVFSIDNINQGSFSVSSFQTAGSAFLFYARGVTPTKPGISAWQIKITKIWNESTLVRDFVPVLDKDKKPAMFDRVNGQLYYNAGTGTFKTDKTSS